MAVRIYKDSDNLFRLDDGVIPAGAYRLVTTTNPLRVGIYGNTNFFPLIKLRPLSEIQDESGTPYASIDALLTELAGFFDLASNGGVGGVTQDHIFASTSERDTHFTNNLDELITGTPIFVRISNQTHHQVWGGTSSPVSYDNTDWVDDGVINLTAAQIKSLYESNANTNALTDAKLGILGHLTENPEGNVVSDVTFIFPPDSVFVSENLGIEGAGEAFGVFDRANNRRGYLVAYEQGIDEKPFYRNLDSFATNVAIQPTKDTVSASDTYTEDITFTANRLVTKVYLESPNTTTGARIRVRRGGFTLAEESNVDFTADIVKEIDIPQGVFCSSGGTVTLDIQGVVLKGTGAGQSFETAINIDNYIYTDATLAAESFVNTGLATKEDDLGNPSTDGYILSSTAAGVRSWVAQGGGGMDSDAIHDNVDDEINQITEKTSVNNNDLVIIEDSEDGFSKKKVTLANLDGGQSYHKPTLQNLTVDIASRVDLNTDLNTSHTFTWDAHNSANLSTLTIAIISGANVSITLPIVDGANSLTTTLSGINTSTAGTLTFQLTGTDTQSNAVSSNIVTITIADVAPHEYLYDGLHTSNDFSTVDLSGFDQQEVGTPGQTFSVSTGAVTSGQYFGILTLNSHTVTIFDTILQQDVTNIFTRTQNTRVINSQNFDSYVVGPLNTDPVGQSYNVTIN